VNCIVDVNKKEELWFVAGKLGSQKVFKNMPKHQTYISLGVLNARGCN